MFGIIDIISSLFGMGKTWLEGRTQRQKAKLEMQLAEIENKARLLRDKAQYNHMWEMAALTDKDKWLRRFSFTMFAGPFFVAIFAPNQINLYFTEALHNIPTWWIQIFVGINGSIWGISSLKNIVPQLVDIFKRRK